MSVLLIAWGTFFGGVTNLWTPNSIQLWYHWPRDVVKLRWVSLVSLFIFFTFTFYGDLCSPQHRQGWYLISSTDAEK